MTDPLQRALAQLILRHPFLSSLALRLERIEDLSIATASTDGVRLAVNPVSFAQLSEEQRVMLVAHECYHVALGHHLRRGGREPRRWNRACDYAVNALLAGDGFRLLPGALLDPAFGDASAEAIYHRLPSDPPASPPGPTPAGASSSGDGAASTPGSPPASSSTPDPTAPPANPGAAPSPSEPGALPAPAPGPETLGEVCDAPSPPLTPASQEARLAEHAVLITALAQQARAAGRDSAGARRAATVAARIAAVNWRALLAEFLTARHAQDYSFRRPNPRYVHLGLFLPLLEAAAPGRVAFVLDTSGSVPQAALDAVTAELDEYLRLFPTMDLDVLYADAEVTGQVSYTAADLPLRLQPTGGGGTDFRPALTTLAEADEPPACVVYLTDLKGRFPEAPPPMPVLWLVFGQPLGNPTAPFGKVVTLPY